MTPASHVSVRWPILVAGSVVLLALGAGATYVGLGSMRQTPSSSGAHAVTAGPRPVVSPPSREMASSPMVSAPLPDIVVPLPEAAARRAGITVVTVSSGTVAGSLRAPGVVEPNAYKRVSVTPLVSGRVTRVTVELGQQVQRGQTIAQIFSPELADSETRYISARAELEAHERELARTERLVQIGAASRQELERIHAEHTARRAGLQSASARLRLLGLSASAIDMLDSGKTLNVTVSVPAPIGGVITERAANVGVNVDQATRLFTVVDLSSVWVVADVYEQDFNRVRVGTPATVVTSASPDQVLQGLVSYIDPQISAETRTAKVRVEVKNTRAALRLGMYADVRFGDRAGAALPIIPRSAVQNVGEHAVVYLVDPQNAGQFIEREVQLGGQVGDQVFVLAGVRPGDVVVAEGSFSVRAERERLGLRLRGRVDPPPMPPA